MSGLFSHGLGGTTPPEMRSTPRGQPTVPDLIRPGMAIRSSYGTGGIVVAARGPYTQHRDIHHPANWTILYVLPQHYGRHGHIPEGWSENPRVHGINGVVAVDGRLLKTCGSDEVFISNPALAVAVTRDGQLEMAF